MAMLEKNGNDSNRSKTRRTLKTQRLVMQSDDISKQRPTPEQARHERHYWCGLCHHPRVEHNANGCERLSAAGECGCDNPFGQRVVI
jgi:hypothetical protein